MTARVSPLAMSAAATRIAAMQIDIRPPSAAEIRRDQRRESRARAYRVFLALGGPGTVIALLAFGVSIAALFKP